MDIINGDLVKMAKLGKFDVIVHGCNCFNTMGSGIALRIKQEFPEAYEVDYATEVGDERKLGTITTAAISRDGMNFVVVNAYTQHGTAKKYGDVVVDYPSLRLCFKEIKKQFSGKKIGYPLIGCGLAGGSWEVVRDIIDEELHGENHAVVMYEP